MTVSISADNGAGTTTPESVLSPYETTWQTRNVIHDLVGGDIAISLVRPRPRSGRIDLLYMDEESAFACAQLHQEETSFTLDETDRPHVSMNYVVDGDVVVALDEGTVTVWIVTIGYQATA